MGWGRSKFIQTVKNGESGPTHIPLRRSALQVGAAPDNGAHFRKPPRVTRRIDPYNLRLLVAAARAGSIVRGRAAAGARVPP